MLSHVHHFILFFINTMGNKKMVILFSLTALILYSVAYFI
jgi:hypothetical protein